MSDIVITRGTTSLPQNLVNSFVVDGLQMTVPGNYRIGSSVVDPALLDFRDEIVNYNGSVYTTYIRNDGDVTLTNGETYIYQPASGWLRSGSTATTSDGSSSGGSSGSLTAADVQLAMTNALTSQNQIEFQDTLLEDSTGVLFFRVKTVDEETGIVTVSDKTPSGASYTPVGAVSVAGKSILDLIKNNTSLRSLDTTVYKVTNGNGSTTSTGDYVKRDRSIDSAGAITDRWFNITAGMTAITANIPAQADLKLWERILDDAVSQTENWTQTQATYAPLSTAAEDFFYALNNGTGYSIGDKLTRTIKVDGTALWYNDDSLSGAIIAAPPLADLTRNVSEPFISATVTTSPNTVDNPYYVGAGTNSPSIPVPRIGKKKANRVTLVRTALVTSSPIYAGANLGSLYVTTVDGQTEIVPTSGLRRPWQMAIPAAANISATAFLNKDAASVTIKNWNLSSATYALRFWYSAQNETESYALHKYPQATSSATVTGVVPSLDHLFAWRMDYLTVALETVGKTGQAVFEVQAQNILATTTFQSIGQIVLPNGVNFGLVEMDYSTAGNTFRIVPVSGTFTSYTYRFSINK